MNVLEAQYQNAVRVQINNLYTAYVDVLAARETIRLARASVEGLARVLEVAETLYRKANVTRPEVVRIRMQREAAEVGVLEAREILLRAKRTLAVLLSFPPDQAETLELRGTIRQVGPPPPPSDELVQLALEARPDLIAQRLGIRRAEADVPLARANRFADVYVLYQPYTFQDNSPVGSKSATSWALGVTTPIPIFDRNQGAIQRACLSLTQLQVESSGLERQVITEVIQAARAYDASRAIVRRFETALLPVARRMLDDAFRLFNEGELDAFAYFNTQRDYNNTIRQYRDALVRFRLNMLALNTAVGRRILP